FVRHRSDFDEKQVSGVHTMTIDQEIEGTLPGIREQEILQTDFVLYPLTKKPGASFPDRITVGRTPNNDLVIAETSISRFHAYVRREGNQWVVADAGSKNGSWLDGDALVARKERPLASHATVRLGDVDLIFYTAEELFIALGGT